MSPRWSPTHASSTPSRSAPRSPTTGTTRSVSQSSIIVCRRGSEPWRTRTKIVPSRWSSSSSTRCRPMKPVAPVTKYDMARPYSWSPLGAGRPTSSSWTTTRGSARRYRREQHVRRRLFARRSRPVRRLGGHRRRSRLGPSRARRQHANQDLMTAAVGAASVLRRRWRAHAPGSAAADPGNRSFTTAVYGDAPYGLDQRRHLADRTRPRRSSTPVNADRDVSTVVHVGDIHSGKQFCTEAYDRQIAGLLDPLRRPAGLHPGRQRVDRLPQEGRGRRHLQRRATGQIDLRARRPAAAGRATPRATRWRTWTLVRSIFFPAPRATRSAAARCARCPGDGLRPGDTPRTRSTSRT